MYTQKKMLKVIFGLSVLSLAACSSDALSRDRDTNKVIKKHQPKTSCPIIESGKWHARLDKKTENEGQYRLNVSGEITLPNPGFGIEWAVGPTDKMHPPGLRLSLIPKSSNLMTIQVLTTVPVKHEMDTPFEQFRHVSIYCGKEQLTRIVDVMLTD